MSLFHLTNHSTGIFGLDPTDSTRNSLRNSAKSRVDHLQQSYNAARPVDREALGEDLDRARAELEQLQKQFDESANELQDLEQKRDEAKAEKRRFRRDVLSAA